jgi:hypothetical protein
MSWVLVPSTHYLAPQLHDCHARTGTEFVLFSVRSKTSDYLWPYVVTTSERSNQFFNLALGLPPSDIAVRLKAYCLSGAKGGYIIHQRFSTFC